MPLVTRSTRSPLPLSATRLNPSPPSTAAAAANTTADTTPSSSSSCRHRRPYATTTATTTTTRPRTRVRLAVSATHKGAFVLWFPPARVRLAGFEPARVRLVIQTRIGCGRFVLAAKGAALVCVGSQRAALVLWLSTTRARMVVGSDPRGAWGCGSDQGRVRLVVLTP
ncbi:hypothetical protein Tco_0952398 [Tanacetum coccineum]|uniref:Uncharacterized protein n=1 Tax=Tanacetum coccineum TaxID=301880 RepID=A0ABQ5DYQ9_9ASTR